MIKKCLLHVFVFCTILFSSVYAQQEVQYYEFYDLLDFPLISAISIKYFRNLNEFIYQDKLVISGLRVQQTTGVVNVYKNKAIENFAQVSYTLDSQKRVIKREHAENQGYSATANYTYFFDNFLMPATSSYVSSDLKWNFSETSEVKNDEIVFSRKESGSGLITYLIIKLDSQKRIIYSEVKPTNKSYGSFGEYIYNKDNSYKIRNFETQLGGKKVFLSESFYDSFSRLRKKISYGGVRAGCKTTIPSVNGIEEWRYKFDSRGNWVDKAYFYAGCDGILNGFGRYERKITYLRTCT